jgi:hypothetical protein
MPTATIKVFLVHGDPKRLRTAELSNWTGKAVAGPRSEFEDVLAREESERSGVYLLTGIDPESDNPAIYIGEAESIRARIRAHLEKDFWNQSIYFVGKDDNLTKAHARYLEGRLIELAHAAARATVVNGQSSGARLPESDREDMEVFLEKICQLLPVLGVDLLVAPSGEASGAHGKALLVCEIKGLKATGYRIPNGFLVLKGSEAVSHERASSAKWPWPRSMRHSLKEDLALVEEGDRLVFSRNVEFASPSAAAAVIHGGHANGLTAWKTLDGKTLKEIEAAD